VRTNAEIRAELERATVERTQLWEELSHGRDPEKSAIAARLSARIDDLWAELRAVNAARRHGTPDLIQARARAEERLERDTRRKAA
jgi:hypothetical protein